MSILRLALGGESGFLSKGCLFPSGLLKEGPNALRNFHSTDGGQEWPGKDLRLKGWIKNPSINYPNWRDDREVIY